MTDPYQAQIQVFPYTFPPRGWAWCNGQLLTISQNTAMFSLLGTTYGGDGRTTFGLPSLQGRVPVGQGNGPGLSPYLLGQYAGVENVMLTTQEIPAHSHTFNVSGGLANERKPPDALFAVGDGVGMYTSQTGPTASFSAQAVKVNGNSAPHTNMMPFLGVNFCIALQGVWPPRTPELADAPTAYELPPPEDAESG